LQDELLGAENGIYSTFFRSYDPTIGRFQGVDPLADQYAGDSPYSFSFNDPVNFNDPNGDDPIFVNGRYVTPHVFGGEAGGWGGGGREGSDLSHMMQQGWVGTSGYVSNVKITITTTGVNYLGDGNGNIDPKTASPWSYSTTFTGAYSPVFSPVFLTPRVLPWAGGAAAADGPFPIGDAIGATALAGGRPVRRLSIGASIRAGPRPEMNQEIDRIRAKAAQLRKPGEVYRLQATNPGAGNVLGCARQTRHLRAWKPLEVRAKRPRVRGIVLVIYIIKHRELV
jgi:RHS repeat-associated protein